MIDQITDKDTSRAVEQLNKLVRARQKRARELQVRLDRQTQARRDKIADLYAQADRFAAAADFLEGQTPSLPLEAEEESGDE